MLSYFCIWLHGQEDKISPLYGGNTGSIPVGVLIIFRLSKEMPVSYRQKIEKRKRGKIMVTLQKIGGDMNRNVLEITGLSTDEKPVEFIETTYITNGSTYEEIDTGTVYKYNESGKKWIEQPAIGGSGGNISLDYTALTNKPQISGIELTGNKTLDDLGIQKKVLILQKKLIQLYRHGRKLKQNRHIPQTKLEPYQKLRLHFQILKRLNLQVQ